MKSRMVISLMVIALAAALIGGATMAWFTDSASSEPVTFTAGTLLIDIDNFQTAYEGFNLDRLNPGNTWDYSFDIVNEGTKNFKYKVAFCWQDILGNTLVDFGGRQGFGTDPLSDVVEFTIYDADNNIVMPIGTLENKTSPLEFEVGQLNAGNTASYRIEAHFPTDAGNEYQGSKMNAAFVVMAGQTRDDAPYADFVCPLLALYPSTNLLNQQNNRPHVNFVSADDGSVTLEFVNDTNSLAFFEYRIDGVVVTAGTDHPNPRPWIGDNEVIHPGVSVDGRGVPSPVVVTQTFNANYKVEVRLALGGERDWDFDWTPFYVVQ